MVLIISTFDVVEFEAATLHWLINQLIFLLFKVMLSILKTLKSISRNYEMKFYKPPFKFVCLKLLDLMIKILKLQLFLISVKY